MHLVVILPGIVIVDQVFSPSDAQTDVHFLSAAGQLRQMGRKNCYMF